MKKLILPLVIALIAGLGAGTGYTYMRTPDAAHNVAATDSTSADSTTHAVPDSSAADSSHRDSVLTPAESLRAVIASRSPLKTATAGLHDAASSAAAKDSAAAPVKPEKPAPTAREIAAMVERARKEAVSTSLPEDRLARIFAQMQARDASKVLEQMEDHDIRSVLDLMPDKKAAAILSALPPARAASITRGVSKQQESDQ